MRYAAKLMRLAALVITASVVNLGAFQRTTSPETQSASAAKAADLVQSLLHPRYDPAVLTKNFGREPAVDRAIAKALVALNDSALPDIEEAFNSIPAKREEFSPSFRWLLFAYAQIRGKAACGRLRVMVENPTLRFLRGDLDQSLAIALGLTSYVSASRVADEFICCRDEPRHSLDRLILAWMQGNRSQIEEELGPTAHSAFTSLLSKQTWITLLREMWGGEPHANAGVGFRFDRSDDWVKPEETLDSDLQARRRRVNLDDWPANPKIATQFVDGSGKTCRKRDVTFQRVPKFAGSLWTKYVIDEADMPGLLRTIATCAKQ
jgi:hypothetical protein